MTCNAILSDFGILSKRINICIWILGILSNKIFNITFTEPRSAEKMLRENEEKWCSCDSLKGFQIDCDWFVV